MQTGQPLRAAVYSNDACICLGQRKSTLLRLLLVQIHIVLEQASHDGQAKHILQQAAALLAPYAVSYAGPPSELMPSTTMVGAASDGMESGWRLAGGALLAASAGTVFICSKSLHKVSAGGKRTSEAR